MALTDNVVLLMLDKIQTLPLETQHVLSLAACMGHRFDLANLGIIAEKSTAAIFEGLQAALRDGLIAPLDRGYQFTHDRIQQAAYSLIPDADKRKVHLEIGRLLLEHMRERDREEQLFTVVDHLNIGSELLKTRDERLQLARLNLRAGSRAKTSAAFSAATKYFEAGVGMLDRDSWETNPDLTLELFSAAAEATALVGEFERTDQLFAAVIQNALDPVDVVGVYVSRMMAFSAQGRLPEFIDCALEILERLGVHIKPNPTAEDIGHSLAELMSTYDPNAIETLAGLPKVDDPRELAIARVLDLAQNSAYSGRPDLFALFAMEATKRTIRLGFSPSASHALTHFALLLLGLPFGDIEQGYKFGMLAKALAEKERTSALAPTALATTAGMIWQYKRHLGETPEMLKPLYSRLKEVGDFEYAGYALCWYGSNALLSGRELEWLDREMAEHHADMKRIRAEVACRWQSAFWQTVQNLLGHCECPWVLDGEAYARESMLQAIAETGNLAAQTALHVSTLALCYLFQRYSEALEASTLTERCKAGMVAMPIEPLWYFYDSLTRLALYRDASESERQAFLERVAANQAYLEMRARHAPMNYLHKWSLVEAERARVLGDKMAALEHYRRAIALARENGFIQEEALASEVTARFWLGEGDEDYARLHLRRAHSGYARWQAWAKASALEAEYPQLRETPLAPVAAVPAVPQDLDILAAFQASRAISGEIVLDNLLKTLMRIVLEIAGARKGYLLLSRNEELTLAAEARVEEQSIVMRLQGDPAFPETTLPASIVNYVRRSGDRVLLDDATGSNPYSADEYFARRHPKSVLCFPITRQTNLVGLLYLENDLATHAFTSDRLAVLELLAAQAAISLENAWVYADLRASEQKFHAIFDQTFQFIGVMTVEGILLQANQTALQFAGVSENAVIGKLFWETPWWAHSVKLQQTLRAAIQEAAAGRLVRFEATHTRRDGEIRYFDFSLKPVTDDQGHVILIIPEGRDITEPKRAEEELRASDVRYRRIVDTAAEGIWMLDQDYLTVFVNAAMAKMLGYPIASMLGRPFTEFLFEEDLPDNLDRMEKRKQGLSEHYERRFPCRDNRTVWTLVSATPVFDDAHRFRGSFAMFTDITERKAAEKELRELNNDFVTLLENTSDFVYFKDRNNRFRFSSQALANITGHRSWRDMIGKDDFEVFPDEVARIYREEEQPIFDEGKALLNKSDPYFDAQGTRRWVNANKWPVVDDKGAVVGIFGISRDVTELKKAEERLNELNRNLEQRVSERTNQLEAANKELEAFAYSVSHDLRAPLRHIDGFLELLQQNAGASLGEKNQRYMTSISGAAKRMGALIDDLLSFSRMGRSELTRREVDLGVVVREVIAEFDPEMRGRLIHWQVADLPVVVGDLAMLRIVFSNLLSNALKFTRPRERAEIEIGYLPEGGGETVLFVRDNGVGFDMRYVKKLFGVFQRLHREDEFEGTGIGLANVRRVIARHGGRTWAEGKVDGGATFYIALPRGDRQGGPA